jgi:acyl-coenzyme A synthetase/AMP-(fatty) acid ligase/thioesterase domain-containing protein/acyl carrier protein
MRNDKFFQQYLKGTALTLKVAPNRQWLSVSQQEPLDRDGPVDVPFESFDAAWISRPICDRFDRIAARYSEKTAVDDGVTRFTYAEMQRASIVLAHSIEACVPPGRPVGVLLKHSAFFPIAALACLRVGRPVVPIDPGQPAERIALIGREAGLQVVIVDRVDSDPNGLFANIPRLDVVSSFGVLPDQAPESAPADGAAFILYTSGSVGRPKGICNNQSAILHRVAQFTNACHLNADDRFILLSSTGTIAGIRDIFTALLNGATLIIAEPAQVGFGGILRAMARERITICYALPALLRGLFKPHDASSAFRHLRILRLGGDVVWERDIALCRGVIPAACHILIGYGSTEAPTVFQWFVPPDWSGDGPRMPCGRLVPDVSIRLVDEKGNSSGAEEIGELLVRSRHLALGLWQDGQLQSDLCESDTLLAFFRSGDLVRLREDGLAELVGRKGRWLKIYGQRVDPGEVEGIARSSDEVADAAVVVRTEDDEAVGIEVFVVPRDSAKPPRIDDLQKMMAQRLPGHMRPNRIHIVDAIPLLTGFKPDLAALAKLGNAGIPETRQDPDPGPPVQLAGGERVRKAVEYAWSKVLNRKSVEMDEPWDAAGGDSLKALSLILLIEEALGVQVPLDLLRQSTRPNDLTCSLDRLLATPNQSNVPGHETAGIPLVFLMPGLGGDEQSLAELRVELGDRIRFVLIEYPSSSAMIKAGIRFDVITDAVVAQIRKSTQSDEVIHLAGYSFGGFVAWEVAKSLRAAGARVGAIGLIDARRGRDVANLMSRRKVSGRVRRSIRNILIRPRHIADRILWLTIYSIVKRAPLALLQSLPSLTMRLPAGIAIRLLLILNGTLRARALNNFTLSKFDHPATLFRSTDHIEEFSDHVWCDVCPQLVVVPIDGTHVSMLEHPRRAALAERLLEAVAEAETRAPVLLPVIDRDGVGRSMSY